MDAKKKLGDIFKTWGDAGIIDMSSASTLSSMTGLYEPYKPAKPIKRLPKPKLVFDTEAIIDRGDDMSEFCQAFVYSKTKGNLLFTGRCDSVERHIKELFPDMQYFVNYTFWKKRRILRSLSIPPIALHHNIWKFGYDGITVTPPKKKLRRYKYVIKGNSEWERDNPGLTCPVLQFKRMPNKWIRDFDFLICT